MSDKIQDQAQAIVEALQAKPKLLTRVKKLLDQTPAKPPVRVRTTAGAWEELKGGEWARHSPLGHVVAMVYLAKGQWWIGIWERGNLQVKGSCDFREIALLEADKALEEAGWILIND